MPQLQSYAQTLKHQISPTANQLLNKVFDDFSEKLKNPDSPERKVFDTIVAIIACNMLTEKLVQETHALLFYLQDLNRRHDEVKQAKPIEIEDTEKEEEAEEVDINEILADLDEQLGKIQEKRSLLEREFDKNMGALKGLEVKALDKIFSNYKVAVGQDTLNAVVQFYEEHRGESRSERIKNLTMLLQAALGSECSPDVIKELAKAIDAKEHGFTLLKKELVESYAKAIKELDGQTEKILSQKSLFIEKLKQQSPGQTSTATPESEKKAEETTTQATSTPTLKPGSGST